MVKVKENKGFTLVELIVVIVILAILIGVTIGGIYMYVGQARVNTDINNDSAIETACSTMNTNPVISTWANISSTKGQYIFYESGENGASCYLEASGGTLDNSATQEVLDALYDEIASKLPDGKMPASQTKHQYKITVTSNGDGTVKVDCNLDKLAKGTE